MKGCILTLITLTLLINSCKKVTDPPVATVDDITGNYNIINFLEDGNNETDDVKEYVLQFNSGDELLGISANDTLTGTWENDDSDSLEMKIFFEEAPLNMLNRSWHILTLTDNDLILGDDDLNDDSEDRLELKK